MLDETVIQKLKQTNVGVDVEKTKERVKALWKSATPTDRETIKRLAGVSTATVQRIYTKGSISTKLAVPIAQTLNVSPLYLTGEADEPGECTDKLLNEFLVSKGYDKLTTKEKNNRGRKGKASEEPTTTEESRSQVADTNTGDAQPGNTEQEPKQEVPEQVAPNPDEQPREETKNNPDERDEESIIKTHLDDMTEEDVITLIRAEFIRQKFGAVGAAERVNQTKIMLLSR